VPRPKRKPEPLPPAITTDIANVPASLQAGPDLLNEREVAAILRLSTKTLQSWRSTNRGPVYVRVGGRLRGRILYSRAAITEYLTRNIVTTEMHGAGRA